MLLFGIASIITDKSVKALNIFDELHSIYYGNIVRKITFAETDFMRTSVSKLILPGLLSLSISITSCSVGVSTSKAAPASSKKVPPGKAKKINGDKSARKYAPGHNKG